MAVIPKAGEVFHGDDGTVSVVLPDRCDPNYEPAQDELEDYAEWLGIDLERERHLLWVAREGLRTPLSEGWKACRTDENEIYYFNFCTGESSWDHPMDNVFKEKLEAERVKSGAAARAKKKGAKDSKSAEERRLEKGAAGHVEDPKRAKGPLLSTPSPTAFSPVARGAPAPLPRCGRLGAIGTPEAAQLVAPDVRSLVAPKSGLSLGATGGRAGKAPEGVREWEAAISHRVGEEIDAQRRAMRVRQEKCLNDTRAALEAALRKAKVEQDAQLAAEREQRAQNAKKRAQEELDAVRRGYEREVAEVEGRLREMRERHRREEAALETDFTRRVAETKGRFQVQQSDTLRRQRETAAAEMEREKKQLREKGTRQLAEAQQEAQRMVAEAKEKSAAEEKRRLDAVHAELEAQQDKVLTSPVSVNGNGATQHTTNQIGAGATQRKTSASTAAAEAEANLAAQLEAIRREYDAQEVKLKAAKEQILREKAAATAAAAAAAKAKAASSAPTSSSSSHEEEEQRLRRAVDERAIRYAEETNRLVEERRKLCRPSSGSGSSSSQGNSASTSNAPTVEKEQRRYELAARQLDTQHATAMDRIRTEHTQTLRQRELFDPRADPTYTEKNCAAQQAWILANPALKLEMPSLKSVPSSPGLMGVEATPMPTEAELKSLTDAAVAAARGEDTQKHEKRLEEIGEKLSMETRQAVEEHRARRLEEVRDQLARHRATRLAAQQVKPIPQQMRKQKERVKRNRPVDAVTLPEATRLETELQQQLQARLDALQSILQQQLQLQLQQHQQHVQQENQTPPLPQQHFYQQQQHQKPVSALQRPPPCPSTPILNRTVSTIPPVQSLWSSARPSPTRSTGWIDPQTQRDALFEDRLRRAALMLRERRRAIRLQLSQMERARTVWRRDMEVCRANRDRTHATMLRQIKAALEERAVHLNRSVLELRAATTWLRERERRHRNRQSSGGFGEELNGVNGGVMELLERVLARTEQLESYVNQQDHGRESPRQHGTKSPNATSRRHERHSTHTTVRRQHSPREQAEVKSSVTGVATDNATPILTRPPLWESGPQDVTQWLMEQPLPY